MDVVAPSLLLIAMIVGLVVIPFGLPGAAIILLSVLVYVATMGFGSAIGIPLFVALCVLTIIAETADNWLSAIGTHRYGGSKTSIWLSFLGGIAGAAILGGPLVFVLGPLAPVAGGFAGAFLAVVVYEYHRHGNVHEAVRAGWGTMLGRTAGILLKMVIAAAMITAVAFALFSRSVCSGTKACSEKLRPYIREMHASARIPLEFIQGKAESDDHRSGWISAQVY